MEDFFIGIIVGLAVFFLVKRFFFKKTNKGNCDSDCNCGS